MTNEEIAESHRNMVVELAKPGVAILRTLDPMKVHMLHMAVGISGETGEQLEHLRRYAYGNGLGRFDLQNFIEEQGDIEFYAEGLRLPMNFDYDRLQGLASSPALEGAEDHPDAQTAGPGQVLFFLASGQSIAAGNILDLVKKWAVYNKPEIDLNGIMSQLVILHGLAKKMRDHVGVTRAEVLQANGLKLKSGKKARYPSGYNDQAAQDRADKLPEASHAALTDPVKGEHYTAPGATPIPPDTIVKKDDGEASL